MHAGVIIFSTAAAMILLAACFMYIVIMGPSQYHRNGLVGKLHRILTALPAQCGAYFCCFFCAGCNYDRGSTRMRRCGEHTFSERNRFMVIFYIILVIPTEILYLLYALPSLHSPPLSKAMSWYLVLQSELFYLLAIYSNPGIVTPMDALHDQAAAFSDPRAKRQTMFVLSNTILSEQVNKKDAVKKPKYLLSPKDEFYQNTRHCVDSLIHVPGVDEIIPRPYYEELVASKRQRGPRKFEFCANCRTCRVPRPCRSKHCKLCNVCVRRFDHHCPWINNDVAEGTHRWFLLFLLTHAISCTWASLDLSSLIYQFLASHRLLGWKAMGRNGRIIPLSFLDYVAILVSHQTIVSCLLFFAFFIGLVLWVFWAYQMTFCVRNLTTSDLMRMEELASYIGNKDDVQEIYKEAMLIKARLEVVAEKKPVALQKLPPPPDLEPLPTTMPGGGGGGEGATANIAQVSDSVTLRLIKTDTARITKANAKKVNKYKAAAQAAVLQSLRGLYDRGMWKNVLEILFPYKRW